MSNWLIPVSPDIELNSTCPIDGFPLIPTKLVIPGIHCLVETICEKCKKTFITDLPVGQAIWSPATIDVNDKKLYDPMKMEFFNNPLFHGYIKPNYEEIVPIVHVHKKYEKIVIVNCLDYLYGHTLLKLLNVQYYLDNHNDIGVCVLVPTPMVHLIPDGVAEVWEFKVSFQKMQQWFASLDRWFAKKITEYKECFLSPAYSHPDNKNYDLNRFISKNSVVPDVKGNGGPVIVFNYREDRLWGKTCKKQFVNIAKIYDLLVKIFPDVTFVVMGLSKLKEQLIFKSGIVDLRVEKITLEQELKWLAYMKAADCTIGVHGSNMLLPTGLAKSTVELVPRSRLGNIVQDFLFAHDCFDVRDVLLRYKLLYGNNALTDVMPSNVVDLVITNLSFSKISSAWFSTTNTNTEIKAVLDSDNFKKGVRYLTQIKSRLKFFKGFI